MLTRRLLLATVILTLALVGIGGASAVEYDVVVVGGGGAGLHAAIEAAEAGASVVVLEKMPFLGGNTLISAGVANIAATDQQKSTGVEDSPDLHFDQTLAAGDYRGNPELVRIMVDEALDIFLLWEELGIDFEDYVFQVYGGLYPRGHEPKDSMRGVPYIQALSDRATALGVSIYLNTEAVRLLREEPLGGRVYGVVAHGENGEEIVFEGRAIIMATGGFAGDVDMRMRFDPRLGPELGSTNHVGANASGIIMAQDIGADTTGMDYIQGVGPLSPVSILQPGMVIYVNNDGNRFVDEGGRRDVMFNGILSQPGQTAWVVCDNDLAQIRPPGERALVADTLEELAEKMGVPVDNFLATVERFNSYVEDGRDLEFGRVALETKLDSPPFYAGLGYPVLHHTMGGLRINTHAQVLDRHDNIIPGLFAAGEVTGGIHGTNRVGGNALTDMGVFGRIAGRNAAIEALE